MTIPWQTLRRVAAFAIVTWAWLTLNEAVLPAERKADRLVMAPVCLSQDYQNGECL